MANYLALNLIFIAAVCIIFRAVPKLRSYAWWLTLVHVLALTAVFDSIIVHLGIVAYDSSQLLGVRIIDAPIEDFSYSILAVILVPHIWEYLGKRPRYVDTVRKLFWISRPVSWLNTAYPFAAGYIVAGGELGFTWLVATGYFLVSYNLLMYGVNDVFDYESDIRNPRKGGIEGMKEQRAFHPTIVKAAVASNIPPLVYLFLVGDLAANIVLVVLVFFVLAYSVAGLRFKEIPFLDSITSSIHFVGPLIYALALVGFSWASWPYLVAFFAWGMASHAFGAVQDIQPDRMGGLKSIGTVLGARATVWFVIVLYCLAIGVLALQGVPGVVVSIAGLMYVANVMPYLSINDTTSSNANSGWRRFIWLNFMTGFVVTMVLIFS